MHKRIKVLFVIESLSGGGAEKVLSTLVKLIDKQKFHITVCTIVDVGVHAETVKRYADEYISVLGNPDTMDFFHKFSYKILYKLIYHILPMRWVYKLFIPSGADIEVAFVEGYVTKLMAYSTNKKSKKIAWIHTDLEKNHWTSVIYKTSQYESLIYQKYNKVVCVSQAVQCSYERLFHSPSNSYLCYNPIDYQEIINQSKEKSTLPGKKRGIIRLISCGRLVKQKGYDRLIKAVQNIEIRENKIELFIFGAGEEQAFLEKLITMNHLEDVVHLCGFHKNIYSDVKSADLFVCSSRAEGFSLVIAEALILGVPVLSTYCSGPDELLENGKYGVLCENSTEGLVQSLKELCENNNTLAYYKEKASIRGEQLREKLSIAEVEHILIS